MKYFNAIVHNTDSKGFTLLETLASVAVLTFVIIGPLAVIISSSSYARQTKDTMVATYLAEEAVEMLQNQQDSLYVFCKKNPIAATCLTSSGESSAQISWRVFKQRLNAVDGAASCYSPASCTFDYIGMNEDIALTPMRYSTVSTECSTLTAIESTSLASGTYGQKYYTYVCRGVPTHVTGIVTGLPFIRSVSVEQLPTFELGTPDDQYQDDIRVTVEVSFKGTNGLTQRVKVVRFFHARA